MRPRIIQEYAVGIVLIFLGVLFSLFIAGNALDVATNVIFLIAGFLIISRAYQNSKKGPQVQPKQHEQPSERAGKERQKLNPSRRRRRGKSIDS